MHSLSGKLWLAMALVALLGVGTVAVIVGMTVSHEFTLYTRRGLQMRATSWAPVLADYYQQGGSWEGVESLLSDIAQGSSAMQDQGARHGKGKRPAGAGYNASKAGQPGQHRVLLLDAQGRVLADSQGALVGQVLSEREREQAVAIQVGERIVGMLLLTTSDLSGVSPLEQEYLQAVKRAVLYASIAVIIVALLASTVLSHHLLAPLQRLTHAAEEMAAGARWPQVQVRSRDEIGELARALNTMAASLEAVEAQRRRMTADIAHELRNPLSVMRSNLEALFDDVYPLDKEHLTPVYEETLLLQRLVDDLRLLSLAESGQLSLQRQAIDVADLLDSVAESMRVVAEDKDIALQVQVEPGLPPLQADADRLRQVLGNLLSNALRYTPRGGAVTLSAARGDGGRIRLQVADTGPGIAPEDLPHVFERFYRGEQGHVSGGGSGLGLAIARALVEAHGGTISVESELGRGTIFTVLL